MSRIEKIKGLLFLFGFLLLVGTAGALEHNSVTLLGACLQGGIGVFLLLGASLLKPAKKRRLSIARKAQQQKAA